MAWAAAGLACALLAALGLQLLLTLVFAQLVQRRLGRRPELKHPAPGAAVVLWEPGAGLPWPTSLGDWLGVAGGAAFAWLNVQLRGMGETPAAARALAMSIGSALVPAAVGIALVAAGMISPPPVNEFAWLPGSIVLAVILLVANAALQFGAPRLPTRVTAIVMLTEVPVAALSSVLIAGETLRPHVLAGGTLIVMASLAAALSLRPRKAKAA